jgi:hypothetical protein
MSADALDPEIAGLLGRTTLRVDTRLFIIVGVSPSLDISVRKALAEVHAPFFVQFFPHEQTIVLAEDEWARVRAAFPGAREEPGYRLITLEANLDWQVVGYLSVVTGALAKAGIPVGVLSSFHHDHLLVRADRRDKAVAALRHLIDAARAATSGLGSASEGSL